MPLPLKTTIFYATASLDGLILAFATVQRLGLLPVIARLPRPRGDPRDLRVESRQAAEAPL